MRTILISFLLAALARAGCVAVSSGRITARDLRDAVPVLQELDPDTPLGLSPLPGTERILSGRELMLLAQKHGLTPNTAGLIHTVCIQRALSPISGEDMKAALVAALNTAGAELELIEFSELRAPAGKLEFRRSGLGKPPLDAPDSPVVWRGRLIYDGQRSMMVWAKVKVSADRVVLLAAQDIALGAVIGAEQIKEVHERQFPFIEPPLPSPESIIGKIARRNITAGQRFSLSALDEPQDISRGDKVHVRVIDGSATLSLDAIAQSSGRKGESIMVHNPSTGKNFRAVVEERGKATARSTPGA